MNHIVDFDRHYEVCVAYWLQRYEKNSICTLMVLEGHIYYCLQVISTDRTLNELWTSVSSRSMTMHFFPTSSARISGSSCFVDLLWLFCLESRHKSPDPDAPEPPIPLPTKDDSRPFFPFPFLFLPRQQIMEQSKLDLFFVSEIRLTWWNNKAQETLNAIVEAHVDI